MVGAGDVREGNASGTQVPSKIVVLDSIDGAWPVVWINLRQFAGGVLMVILSVFQFTEGTDRDKSYVAGKGRT